MVQGSYAGVAWGPNALALVDAIHQAEAHRYDFDEYCFYFAEAWDAFTKTTALLS
jgi:hypothetical protein